MKATFALPVNLEIHNLIRKLSWDIHQKYQTGLAITRLPPHVSLKQPFEVFELTLLEEYMAELAESIQPLPIHLSGLELVETTINGFDTGILWLNVTETPALRQLHQRLNQELARRFGNVAADFDGPAYHFHATVAIGGQPIETYRKIHAEFSDRLVNLRYTAQDLAMFLYDQMYTIDTAYMTYRILPLGSKRTTH